jgi:hypothetical protein
MSVLKLVDLELAIHTGSAYLRYQLFVSDIRQEARQEASMIFPKYHSSKGNCPTVSSTYSTRRRLLTKQAFEGSTLWNGSP